MSFLEYMWMAGQLGHPYNRMVIYDNIYDIKFHGISDFPDELEGAL